MIGRKGWLFCNTPRGARSSAIIYSIVETAKENDLIPYEYIKHLLKKLPNIDVADKTCLDEAMPWSDKLPEECRSKKPPD